MCDLLIGENYHLNLLGGNPAFRCFILFYLPPIESYEVMKFQEDNIEGTINRDSFLNWKLKSEIIHSR